jgi:hypothetical protein
MVGRCQGRLLLGAVRGSIECVVHRRISDKIDYLENWVFLMVYARGGNPLLPHERKRHAGAVPPSSHLQHRFATNEAASWHSRANRRSPGKGSAVVLEAEHQAAVIDHHRRLRQHAGGGGGDEIGNA